MRFLSSLYLTLALSSLLVFLLQISCVGRTLGGSPGDDSQLSSVSVGKLDGNPEKKWTSMNLMILEKDKIKPAVQKEFKFEDFTEGNPSVATEIAYGEYQILLEYFGGSDGKQLVYSSCDSEKQKIHKIEQATYTPSIVVCDVEKNEVGQTLNTSQVVIEPKFEENDDPVSAAGEFATTTDLRDEAELSEGVSYKVQSKSDGSTMIEFENLLVDSKAMKTLGNKSKIFLGIKIPQGKCLAGPVKVKMQFALESYAENIIYGAYNGMKIKSEDELLSEDKIKFLPQTTITDGWIKQDYSTELKFEGLAKSKLSGDMSFSLYSELVCNENEKGVRFKVVNANIEPIKIENCQ